MGGHQLDQEKQELENPTAPQPKLRPNLLNHWKTLPAVTSLVLPLKSRSYQRQRNFHRPFRILYGKAMFAQLIPPNHPHRGTYSSNQTVGIVQNLPWCKIKSVCRNRLDWSHANSQNQYLKSKNNAHKRIWINCHLTRHKWCEQNLL